MNDENIIGYALSKQIPCTECEVTITTNYGDLRLEGADAKKVANLVRNILEKKLAKIKKQIEEAV